MPAPGVTTIIDDQSDIRSLTSITEDTTDRPIFMVASSADKGPEEWKHKVFGNEFFDLYGKTPSYSKHGQPLIQAANIINAGGYVTFKRIVATDATLANIGVVAEVKNEKKQKTNDNGLPLFTNPTTNRLTTDANTNGIPNIPVLENFVKITYRLKSVASDGNDVKKFGKILKNDFGHKHEIGEDDEYVLFLLADNGRGASNKSFRIYSDTTSSHPVSYVRYFIDIIENGTTLETLSFTMNPDVVERDKNMALSNAIRMQSKQLRALFFDAEYEAFVNNVGYLIGDDEFKFADVLFGTDLNGRDYNNLSVDVSDGVNLSNVMGIRLQNGSNGSFGDRPINAKEYEAELIKAFDGSFSDDIYDLDNNRIDCIFDANYPKPVKRTIEQLAAFREDFVYFRDMGLNVNSIEELRIKDYENAKNRYCATYMNSYEIYDPYTKKQIPVTVTYDLTRLFVKHFINGRNRPFCGQKYEIIIPNDTYVEGTLNFAPKHTPYVNQFKELDDLRINYLSFYNGDVLTMNSEYTSQTRYTQLSWINNVLAVQQVIKAIRELCPKIRYSFLDGDDLTKYKKDVNDLIVNRYSNLFSSFEIEYVSNALYNSNKIIYACLYVKFRNFVQTEIFKIIALD